MEREFVQKKLCICFCCRAFWSHQLMHKDTNGGLHILNGTCFPIKCSVSANEVVSASGSTDPFFKSNDLKKIGVLILDNHFLTSASSQHFPFGVTSTATAPCPCDWREPSMLFCAKSILLNLIVSSISSFLNTGYT